MSQGKGYSRRVRGLADMTVAPPSDDVRWYPPEPQHTETVDVNVPLGDLGRVIGRLEFDQAGRMTEFCLIMQVLDAGGWRDVVKVDTAHAEVHMHHFHKTLPEDAPEPIRVIRCQDDVDKGYQAAEKLLIVNWEDNLRRWDG